METETKKTTLDSLKDTNQWMRVLYMILFALILYVATAVLLLITVVQAVFALLTGSPNENITKFGGDLSRYIYQITQFWTYNSEEKPFPFGPWPEENAVDLGSEESVVVESADDVTPPPAD